MKKILKYMDRFSREFNLSYKGKGKIMSEFGGLITIIALIIILFNAFMIGSDLFYKRNPTVLTVDKYLDVFPTTRINYKNMFIGFLLLDKLKNPLDDESYIKVVPSFDIVYMDKNNTLKHKQTILELTDCKSEFERLNITSPFINQVLDIAKCIKNFDYILSGYWLQNPFLYINFQVLTCKNGSTYENFDFLDKDDKNLIIETLKGFTSSNQLEIESFTQRSIEDTDKLIETLINSNSKSSMKSVECKPLEEIKEKIPYLQFAFLSNKISINPKSYSNPIDSQGNIDVFQLGYNLKKQIVFDLNHNIISTDSGYIFKEKNHQEISIGYSKYSIDYSSKEDFENILLRASFKISNNVQYLNRDYIKVQNVFANLGGFMKFVLLLFQIIYDPFFNRKLNLKIMNKIFEFEERDLDRIYNISKTNQIIQGISINLNIPQGNKNLDDKINNNNNLTDTARENKINSMRNLNKFFIDGINNNEKKNKYLEKDFSNPNKNQLEISQNPLKYAHGDVSDINNKDISEQKQNGNKLKYTNIELFKYLYCRCFFEKKKFLKKNDLYNWANENLYEYTDFLNIIKIHRDISKLKYFVFNNPKQIKIFEFIKKPKKFKNDIIHHNVEFAEIFKIREKKDENINELIEYFNTKTKEKNLDKVDEKLLDVIDPNIKDLIQSVSD